MSKKLSLKSKFVNTLFFIFIIWLIYIIFSKLLSRKKEGYFAPLGKEPFAALGCDPKKDPNCK
jgi:hypothetical protein